MSPLPVELINEILSHCTNGSLARCARTNKTLLDLSRSLLYYHVVWDLSLPHPTMVNNMGRYLFSHTRHVTVDFHHLHVAYAYYPLVQLVFHLQAFGRLKHLTWKPYGTLESMRYLEMEGFLADLIPMSSLTWISLVLDEASESPGLIPFLSSPKLRDLSLILDPWYKDEEGVLTAKFDKLNPPLKFLCHSPDCLDLPNLWHLVITFMQAEVVAVYMTTLFGACGNVTHLTLDFKALSSDKEDIPELFTPIQQLHSLTSLTLKTDTNKPTIDKPLDQFYFIVKQVHPKAPLRWIILYIRSVIPMADLGSHPTVQALCAFLKSRHGPPCQFRITVGNASYT